MADRAGVTVLQCSLSLTDKHIFFSLSFYFFSSCSDVFALPDEEVNRDGFSSLYPVYRKVLCLILFTNAVSLSLGGGGDNGGGV